MPRMVGDLVMLKSLDIVEDEGRARTFRQPRDGSLEVEPLDAAVWYPRRSRHHLFVQRGRHAARPGLAAFQVIETPVHRQAIEPGPHRGVAAKFGELSIGQQKDFLQQVLRVGPCAAHPPREVEQPRRMLPIELLESWHISFGHSARLDEVPLGRVAVPREPRTHWKIRRLLDLRTVVRVKR